MAEKYADSPDGLDGNDDAGTLSAWYVFSALGVFPVAGSDVYAIGSPLFDRMVVRLPKGELVVTAENNGPANVFVQSAAWNGRPLAAPFLRHADLAAGGTLEFVMGPNPSSWGRIP
jgi:putative alpha-1,2-mannosidase